MALTTGTYHRQYWELESVRFELLGLHHVLKNRAEPQARDSALTRTLNLQVIDLKITTGVKVSSLHRTQCKENSHITCRSMQNFLTHSHGKNLTFFQIFFSYQSTDTQWLNLTDVCTKSL